jgi:osmotically-inducible protein OsmY
MNLQTCSETSQSLAERIEQIVRARTGGTIRQLQVDVTDGSVTLSGRTSTYYQKQLATHAVLEAISARTLTNEIEVAAG